MQLPQPVGHLPVDAHRVDEPGHADDAGVGGNEEDRRGEDADVELCGRLEPAEIELFYDPEHRIACEATLVFGQAELGDVLAADLLDRQRRQRDRGQQRVDGEHGDHHALDRLGNRLGLVLGLLGHVRDRLDAGVRDHADRDRDEEVLPLRRYAEVDVLGEDPRIEDEEQTGDDHQQLRKEVRDREADVDPGRLLDAAHVHQRQHDDQADREDDVPGAVAQRLHPHNAAQVVRHEEGADRDRDHVVEHLRPRSEERPVLVERVPCERR